MTTNSMETIVHFSNRDVQSEWSVIWSTTHVAGINNATATDRRLKGRRCLRLSGLALGSLLVMHCRIPASALSQDILVFVIFLIISVLLLANPMRHFELYLGQWSISGPGRAFRIVPMLDGIGIAMCINALARAIICSAIASIIGMYIFHTVNDAPLPYTYCRNFQLEAYEPYLTNSPLNSKMLKNFSSIGEHQFLGINKSTASVPKSPVALQRRKTHKKKTFPWRNTSDKRKTCKEHFSGSYPNIFNTPPYNFFYVELTEFKSEFSFKQINIKMVFSLFLTWVIIWTLMIAEHIYYGKLMWNNLSKKCTCLPWLWVLLLGAASGAHIYHKYQIDDRVYKLESLDIISLLGNAFEVALYIHSSSSGTEMILGKGLNHYASGHIDPKLNSENVWHSVILTSLVTAHTASAGVCSLANADQSMSSKEQYKAQQSTLWILPLYSKCTLVNNYSHLVSTLLYGGLMFSYIIVSFILVKTAVHIIIEYCVHLVFIEQIILAITIISCFGLSLVFTCRGGLLLLEQIDTIMTGVSMPLICLLELVCLLYVYRSGDFLSDINIANEDNAFAARIGLQWQIIPFMCLVTLILKVLEITKIESYVNTYMVFLPLVAIIAVIPLRAVHNAFIFLHPIQRFQS